MEIRVKVEEYVNQKILALRQNHPGSYDNVSILRMNAMKFLPNFFEKHQVGNKELDLGERGQSALYKVCLLTLQSCYFRPEL
jgi:hypothetical protein